MEDEVLLSELELVLVLVLELVEVELGMGDDDADDPFFASSSRCFFSNCSLTSV